MKSISPDVSLDYNRDYASLEEAISRRVSGAKGPFFETNATGLWDAYLTALPEEHRQHHNCRCCKNFIEKYGNLVTINLDGTTDPVLWSAETYGLFADSVSAIYKRVSRAKVTGVFINGDKTWGTPSNIPGPSSKYEGRTWTHLHGFPTSVFKSHLLTASQASAEKLQDYIMLQRSLSEIPMEAVVQAVRVLEADVVDRSEKTLGVAKWLLELHQSIESRRGSLKDNLVWLAVAKAPAGWCHVRSSMIGTLLDDVIAGLSFETIQKRWNQKMHPLQYQRPTAPPKDGNIEQANKIVEKLGSEGALARRFARLEEVTALWKPTELPPTERKSSGGAFDHLKTKRKQIKEVELPPIPMTWSKFQDSVLPEALKVYVNLPHGDAPYYGLVTAANPDSPPMLQWDGLEGLPRNPVSWYFWHGLSTAGQWGLMAGWNLVSAICLKPCHWQSDKFKHHGDGVFFVIENARDSRSAGGGYFPETLRSEYHSIRSVIESHSRNSTLLGREEGNANGIALMSGSKLTVRVKSASGTQSYQLSL